MKLSTIILAATTVGMVGAVIWYFNKPVDPFRKSDEVARNAGFSSGDRYSEGLKLSAKARKKEALTASDFAFLREMVLNEGDSGQLMALTIILPLEQPDQMQQGLDACREAVTNEKIPVMPERVLSSFRSRNKAVVDEFVARYPDAQAVLDKDR
ncbi:MAG: hypothetical protein M9921_07785 [Fimbriimonadaceae bacterium]|nr:hypothetical protein [Chthonomonadaceae bacterium]MCO5296742.1 hypothetical protein [Fimbriimonadaceae bacterium]